MSNSTMPIDSSDSRLQASIDSAAVAAWKDSKVTRFQSGLDKLEDRIMSTDPSNSAYYTTASSFVGENATAVQAAVSTAANVINIKSIEDGIKSFAESSKVLMNALDAVTQLHPVIGVVVLAFKAVITLELKRRSNDQKVLAIQLKMKDMVSVLLELRTIKDPQQTAPDGTTVEGRIQDLMGRIADDITKCGNACNTYLKKHILVKVIKSPIWEGRLAEYAGLFDQHRKEILFAISLHTTLGVESANVKLENLGESVRVIEESVNMIKLFHILNSPREKDLWKLVKAKGGPKACLEDEAVLKELSESKLSQMVNSHGVVDTAKMAEVKKGLKEDIEKALKSNYTHFEAKVEMQKQEIVKEMDQALKRESDRVISALTSGPHDRVVDKDLHEIWKEMGWKSSVKARHFVLAVHDYFTQKLETVPPPDQTEAGTVYSDDGQDAERSVISEAPQEQDNDDKWTLEYISLSRIGAILEAFDDDGSGFVNVIEVNRFTSTRPKDWSLLHWIAYWAEGWHYSVWDYRNKIGKIIKAMFDLLDQDDIHPANRSLVDLYLSSDAISDIDRMVRSVTAYTEENTATLEEKMRSYVEGEETRLKTNLDTMNWHVDGFDTLALVTGQGRIERYIFPLLYLVLQRHLQILRTSTSDILDMSELEIPEQTLSRIMDAAYARTKVLSAIIRHKSADVSVLLGNVAFGMFRLLNDPSLDDGDEAEEFFPDVEEEDGQKDTETEDDVLNYSALPSLPSGDAYEELIELESDQRERATDDGLQGTWTGHCTYTEDENRVDGLMQINIKDTEDGKFEGNGMDALGTFTLDGQLQPVSGNSRQISFKQQYGSAEDEEGDAWEYDGVLDSTSLVVSGTWGNEGDGILGTFTFSQRPAFAYPFLYTEQAFNENAPLARWKLAVSAIRHLAQKRLWSWSYFKDRMITRKRFVDLYYRRMIEEFSHTVHSDVQLTEEEKEELKVLERNLSPGDVRYYTSIATDTYRRLCIHYNIECDGCSASLFGARLICLICTSDDFKDNMDMCEFCFDVSVSDRGFEHDPSHDSLVVFKVLHARNKRSALEMAKEFVITGRAALGRGSAIECVACGIPVQTPCWFCVECDVETFICADCQKTKDVRYSNESHTTLHSLVRLSESGSSKKPIEDTIDSLEAQLTKDMAEVQNRMEKLEVMINDYETGVNSRISALERMVEQRLSKVEELLLQVLVGISGQPSV